MQGEGSFLRAKVPSPIFMVGCLPLSLVFYSPIHPKPPQSHTASSVDTAVPWAFHALPPVITWERQTAGGVEQIWHLPFEESVLKSHYCLESTLSNVVLEETSKPMSPVSAVLERPESLILTTLPSPHQLGFMGRTNPLILSEALPFHIAIL